MSIALLFWIIMIISVLFTLWANWPIAGANGRTTGVYVVIFILLALLGWAVFGAAVHR